MNKKIIDTLINKGIITTYVDASKYESIDDLINKGIITIPGAKQKIMEIINTLDNTVEPIIVNSEVIDTTTEIIINTPVEETPIDETPVSEEVIIDTPVEETPIDETPIEEPTETVEVIEEVKPKKTKTKKTE